MRPLLHPSLVNGRYGDPTVYVETLFEKRGLVFDLGEITSLSPRKIQRVEQIFVSHAHIDHFIGFDHLLRLLVGREKTVYLYGPSGFAEHVYHKLQSYRWNLVEGYRCDLVFVVGEVETPHSISTTRFRLKTAFAAKPVLSNGRLDGVLHHARPIAYQRRSSNIARPASVSRCKTQLLSMCGRTDWPSEGCLSVRG
jgi:ribonuclease Z